jgi:hypothetical protein
MNALELKKLYIDNKLTLNELAKFYNISVATTIRRLRYFNIRKQGHSHHKLLHNAFYNFTPENCYWAGFIAADGNIAKNSNVIKVKLKYADKNHLVKLCNFLKRAPIFYEYEDKLGDKIFKNATLCFSSRKIIQDLKANFNITPNKTFTLRPPKNIPKYLIRHFIRGYMDGDGHIGIKKNKNMLRLHFCSGSKYILDWIKYNISYVDNISKVNIRKRKNKEFYELEYCNTRVPNILCWLYKNTDQFLARKNKIYCSFGGLLL